MVCLDLMFIWCIFNITSIAQDILFILWTCVCMYLCVCYTSVFNWDVYVTQKTSSWVRWSQTHPDELWSGAGHFEAALMTFCGTLPGLLSARQHRKRPERESVMDKQDIFVSFLKSGEMLYLLSGSSLHSQFLWPQNCTCLLITDPGGGKCSNNKIHEQRRTAEDSWKMCLTEHFSKLTSWLESTGVIN